MAVPAEPSPLPSSSSARLSSVSALFGDDLDSQPQWLNKDAFLEKSFDPDSYLKELRRFVPFDTLRSELKNHLASLKNELVELINRDYADFVNLSTKLVDVDGSILRMRAPLLELRGKLSAIREHISSTLSSLHDGLRRRSDASNARQILELLLDTSHVVSKVEKLLQEFEEMREGKKQIEIFDSIQDKPASESSSSSFFSLEESQSRLLERISSEINRLKFYVVKAENLPFIQNMEKRMVSADENLSASLHKCFENGLQTKNEKIIFHCLRAYSALEKTDLAENIFRALVVAPAIENIFQSESITTLASDEEESRLLSEIYEKILVCVEKDFRFLLDIVSTANSGLHHFDFLSNSILKQTLESITSHFSNIFSSGKPDQFISNYKTSLQFLDSLEKYCKTKSSLASFRNSSNDTFLKQFNLGVYFTLRFQEIAGSLEDSISSFSISNINSVALQQLIENEKTDWLQNLDENSLNEAVLIDLLVLNTSTSLLHSMNTCSHPSVFVFSLFDKFLKLTFQLISRYTSWIKRGLNTRKNFASNTNSNSTGGGEWALSLQIEDFVLIRHDVEILVKYIPVFQSQKITAAFDTDLSDSLKEAIAQSFEDSTQSLRSIFPVLSDIISDAVMEKCVEVLRQLKGITATYRMTNKPLPTRHSHYVSSVLNPLKAFLEGEKVKPLISTTVRHALARSVIDKVTTRYDEMSRELILMARKTESSLKLMKQRANRMGVNPETTASNISDTDKITAQLFLDVKEYGKQIASFGVGAKELESFLSLWRGVAPESSSSVVEF